MLEVTSHLLQFGESDRVEAGFGHFNGLVGRKPGKSIIFRINRNMSFQQKKTLRFNLDPLKNGDESLDVDARIPTHWGLLDSVCPGHFWIKQA